MLELLNMFVLLYFCLVLKHKGERMKKLYLSGEDRKIGGVCGGIGETYDIDPTIVRLCFVFVAIATGLIPMFIGYLVAWAIIPEKPTG